MNGDEATRETVPIVAPSRGGEGTVHHCAAIPAIMETLRAPPMAPDSHLRSLLFLIAAGAPLFALAAPAVAFQEQSAGAGSAVAGAPSAQAPDLDLSLPESGIARGPGTEVRIPGVGTLGVLPKLDFGLELLYGANDSAGARPDDRSQPSDVQIRATIKHRF